MKLQKIVSCVMAVCTLLTVTACGEKNSGVNEEEMIALAPDYSMYNYTMDSYAYAGPNDGYWNKDGVVYYTGKNLKTVEGYQTYKEAGLNIYFPQNDAYLTVVYAADVKPTDYASDFWARREANWEKDAKPYWDKAYEAGLDRIIMMDPQIQYWSGVEYGMLIKPADEVIPDGVESPYTFQSEEEFDATIAKVLEPYVDHPGFYGVMLKDEPRYSCVEAYGQTCRAIKRVAQNVYNRDIFVQHNLIPMRCKMTSGVYQMMPLLEWFDDKEDSISPRDYFMLLGGSAPNQEVVDTKEETMRILKEELAAYGGVEKTVARLKYEKYMEEFVLAMGSDYVQYDDYPMNGTEEVPEMLYSYILTLQAASNVAKKLDIDLQVVSQSFGSTRANNAIGARELTEDDCRWLNNILLSFGVSQINYYTYIAKKTNKADDHYYSNYGSFITRTGEKTDIYYYYQKINQENDKFAPTKLNFKFQGSRVYNILPNALCSEYVSDEWIDNTYTFTDLKEVKHDKEAILVTESYDKANNRYMYAVQNLVDSAYKGSPAYQTINLTFDAAKYKYVAMYQNGERTLQALDNGKLVVELQAGQAFFIIPY